MILVITGISDNPKSHVFNSNNSNNKPIDSVFSNFEIPLTGVLFFIKQYA
jgi:hypothetical protein